MRQNYVGGQSTTGGAGALALTAAAGLALPAQVFVPGQTIEYSIVEYTDASMATVAKAESGFGTITSGNVLTRAAPRTSWDGSTYSQANPAPLSFGSANVRVYVAPIAEGGPTAFPRRTDLSSLSGPNAYLIGANGIIQNNFTGTALPGDVQWVVPLKLECSAAISQLGVQVAFDTGATVSANLAIASTDPSTGGPGTILTAVNGLDVSTTGTKLGSTTPRVLAPGWYWQVFNTNDVVTFRATEFFLPGPLGAFNGASIRNTRGFFAVRLYSLSTYVPGEQVLTNLQGTLSTPDNVPFPLLLMR